MNFKKIFICFIFFVNILWADEGGNSFWFCGQFASLVAVPKNLGWAIGTKLYYFDEKNTDLNQISNGQPEAENISAKTGFFF